MAESLRESRRDQVASPVGKTDETGDTAMGLIDLEALSWAATLDPRDATREIEITDEMVCRAIAAIERDQVYPFGGSAANGRMPQARAVHCCEIIPFPQKSVS